MCIYIYINPTTRGADVDNTCVPIPTTSAKSSAPNKRLWRKLIALGPLYQFVPQC